MKGCEKKQEKKDSIIEPNEIMNINYDEDIRISRKKNKIPTQNIVPEVK